MIKVDVEGTPLKVGDFVWASVNKYNTLKKYEIVGETEKTIRLKSNCTVGFNLHECEKKVLKANN